MLDRILKLPEVLEVTGLSKSTLYRLIKSGDFPKPVRLTSQRVGWLASQVQAWMESLQAVDLFEEVRQVELETRVRDEKGLRREAGR